MSHNIDKLIPPIRVGCPKPKEDKKLLPNAVVSGNTPTCLMDDDKEQVLILTKQYQDLIAQTEAAKAALEARIAQFDKLALQGSNKSATNTAILAALGNVPTEQITGFATEANATANKNAIIAAIPSVSSIQSGLAKDNTVAKAAAIGSSSDAATASTVFGKLAAILASFSNIDIDTTSLAKEATLGASSDSSVSTTVFGWLKSIRDFLVGIVTTNPYAKESAATANKEAIISAINSAQPDLTSVAKEATLGTSSDAATASTVFGKLAAILAAFSNIDIDTSALAQRSDVEDGNDTAISMLKDETTGLAAIKEAIGSGGGSERLEQFFGVADSYEAEAKGGERTNNTVIDECKVRFQDAFNGLLPTGFTMPNSVTVDNLTYTGTTNS